MIEVRRRAFLTGLISLVAAPAIVRFESIMPVRTFKIGPLGLHPLYDSEAYQADRVAFYGRSPAMDALYGRGPMMDTLLPDVRELEAIKARILAAMQQGTRQKAHFNWPAVQAIN